MIDSDIESEQKLAPLSGDKLEAAIRSMEAPGFLAKLTVRIMKLAKCKGFGSLFEEDVDLPGGESAAGLAASIVQKVLEGTYNWDTQKHPDFYGFCCSRAESILSNLLTKNHRMATMSPVEEEGPDGDVELNPVNQAADPQDIYHLLRTRDGGRLGDQMLADFALSVEHPHDQAILMAVHDDRECLSRSWCRAKLGLSESNYDASMKRIRRAGPAFLKDWYEKNNVRPHDQKEAR